ncbi:polymorphic toxin-type HINT domain-containing protein, partial [Actinoalloteichus caeruleus]|uniref:polymorphic toxin-type HINT domain-containing protein n=1 Tax=Actinoalloteichus cyanogriseus TaxID=2893586 RepID=UPI00200FE4E3
TATDEHPFWVDDHGRWTHATDLTRGDTLLTPTGDHTTITHAHSYPHHHRAHNLTINTINTIHTYYVLAGTTPVLVHNSDPCGPDLGDSWKPKPAAQVCGKGGCEEVADHIQSTIGGEIMRITDRYGAPRGLENFAASTATGATTTSSSRMVEYSMRRPADGANQSISI